LVTKQEMKLHPSEHKIPQLTDRELIDRGLLQAREQRNINQPIITNEEIRLQQEFDDEIEASYDLLN